MKERSQKNWGPQCHLRKARRDQRNTGEKGTGTTWHQGHMGKGERVPGQVAWSVSSYSRRWSHRMKKAAEMCLTLERAVTRQTKG